MLKNWILSLRFRNFIKSGLFVDFFLKKWTLKTLIAVKSFSILFLEKFFIEFIFKFFGNFFKSLPWLKKYTTYNNLSGVILLLNCNLIIFLYFVA